MVLSELFPHDLSQLCQYEEVGDNTSSADFITFYDPKRGGSGKPPSLWI